MANPQAAVTMLFTDVEGSTRIARELGGRWAEVLREHDRLVCDAIARYDGEVLRTAGDSFLALFAEADAAASAAVEAQARLAAHDWPREELKVRMGLHTGVVERLDGALVGLDIHLAARIEAAAHGGQIVISGATRDALGNGFDVVALGEHRLKDFPAPEPLFLLRHDGRGPDDFPPLRAGPAHVANLPRDLIGRGTELDEIARFLGRSGTSQGLVIAGEPGIGKTTLARAGEARAQADGWSVLRAAPTAAEAELSFSVLGDVISDEFARVSAELPEPRRRALAGALLVDDDGAATLDQRAVGLALTDVLRMSAARSPLLVLIDDIQWIDAASDEVLAFALHRLADQPIRLLATQRTSTDAPRASVLAATEAATMMLDGLSMGAVGRLVREGGDGVVTRPALRGLFAQSGGNPLFALEMARMITSERTPLVGGPPALASVTLDELLGRRLDELSPGARQVALVTSVLANARVEVVRSVCASGLEEAVDHEIVRVEGDRVRFTHPLLASAAYGAATAGERRQVHAALAEVVREPEERARHLVAITLGPDAEVAETVEMAAELARRRGAPQIAADLAERAAELTPEGEPRATGHRLAQAGWHALAAGDTVRASPLFDRALAIRPQDADALLGLTIAAYDGGGTPEEIRHLGERALAAAQDPRTEARVLGMLAELNLWDFRQAVEHGRAALDLLAGLDDVDPQLEARVLTALAKAEVISGAGFTPALLERAAVLERDAPDPRVAGRSITALGLCLKAVGRLSEAREALKTAWDTAVAEGDDSSLAGLAAQLAWTEMQLGRWAPARQWAEQVAEAAATGQPGWHPIAAGIAAELDALEGDERAARERAAEIDVTEFARLDLMALGLLELSLGHHEIASTHLAELDARAEAGGIGEPTFWHYEANLVEALVGAGDHARAGEHLVRLEDRGAALDRAWALATAARCRGLLLAAEGDVEGALASLEHALVEHERLEDPFERGRTLLALGETQRRLKRRRAARETLEAARSLFEELGAAIWAKRAAGELARISGRAPGPSGLTATEQRVADLAARGHANKEIAAELFISVHTVEANLTRIYAKLDVRSRSELAHRLTTSSNL